MVINVGYFNYAKADLLTSTSCAASGHYSNYSSAKAAAGNPCSGGVGYSRGYIERSTSYSWECTGWNGSSFSTTANCSVSWNPDPVPAQPSCNSAAPSATVTTSGGMTGCQPGMYYCEIKQKCIPNNQSCGICVAGKNCSDLFVPNPNIQLEKEGSVSLKELKATPSIGNSGYSCVIDWSKDTFKSYDNYTKCTFTSNSISFDFIPASTTSPNSYTLNDVKTDTVSKMNCMQTNDFVTDTVDVVCRVNWVAEEVN